MPLLHIPLPKLRTAKLHTMTAVNGFTCIATLWPWRTRDHSDHQNTALSFPFIARWPWACTAASQSL